MLFCLEYLIILIKIDLRLSGIRKVGTNENMQKKNTQFVWNNCIHSTLFLNWQTVLVFKIQFNNKITNNNVEYYSLINSQRATGPSHQIYNYQFWNVYSQRQGRTNRQLPFNTCPSFSMTVQNNKTKVISWILVLILRTLLCLVTFQFW